MRPRIIDSSIALAILNEEPGWERLVETAAGAIISAVNHSEVVGKLADRGADLARIRILIANLLLKVEPFDLDAAETAGMLRPATAAQGLSLGDRACLALGRRLGGVVYTTDRIWRDLDLGVEVVVVR